MTAVLLFLGMAGAASATPPVSRWYMELDVPLSTCVNRAELALATGKVGKIEKSPIGPSAWNKDIFIAVHCVAKGSKNTAVVIFVTGDSGKEKQTHGWLVSLRDSITKGGPFE